MMTTAARIDWTDVGSAARHLAGNWQRDFQCFVWFRAGELEDADQWAIVYTSGRDVGLLAQSNHAEVSKRLAPFMEGDDPDVVAEDHNHWAVGFLSGFSLRVFHGDGSITPAFEEWCRIREELDNYPVLNESDYSEREYQATLDNYRHEMWRHKNFPEGWEAEVYSWFSDRGLDRYIEDRDDQGGWADEAAILEALRGLGLMPAVIVDRRGP